MTPPTIKRRKGWRWDREGRTMASIKIASRIRNIAREHGWAIGIHGTMVRDVDLIAVPWTVDAADWDVLLCDICKRLNLHKCHPTNKPRGRLAFILIRKNANVVNKDYQNAVWDPPAIDLSIMANTFITGVEDERYIRRSP